MIKSIIQIRGLNKTFDTEKRKIEVLKNVNIDISAGEYVLIFGPSGCGKTTLLNHILGLEVPTHGQIMIKGKDIAKFDAMQRDEFRARYFGTVYQTAIWMKSLNVLDNVALPLYLMGEGTKMAQKQALYALTKANMFSFAKSVPNELSIGEQQRINLARALVTEAPIIIADEPTGNLDSQAGEILMNTLDGLHRQGRTIILVTHNLSYLDRAEKKIAMKDGKVIGEFKENKMPRAIEEALGEAK